MWQTEVRFPVELPGLWTCPVVSSSLSNVSTIQQIPSALPRTVRNIISAALWAKLQGQEHGNSPAGGRERSELQLKQQLCYQQDGSLQDHSCPPPVFAGLQLWLRSLFPSCVSSGCGAGSVAWAMRSAMQLSPPQTQNRMGVELGNETDLQSGASL